MPACVRCQCIGIRTAHKYSIATHCCYAVAGAELSGRVCEWFNQICAMSCLESSFGIQSAAYVVAHHIRHRGSPTLANIGNCLYRAYTFNALSTCLRKICSATRPYLAHVHLLLFPTKFHILILLIATHRCNK